MMAQPTAIELQSKALADTTTRPDSACEEAGELYHGIQGYTSNDKRDMQRMGKTQELMVSSVVDAMRARVIET